MKEFIAQRPVWALLVVAAVRPALAFLQPTQAPPPPATETRTWNFDTDKVGTVPDGWSIRSTHGGQASATWQVSADRTAPSKPNVLAIVKAPGKGSSFNLAVREDIRLKDVELSVRIRPNSGKEDQGGGLVWRCKDENNYYVCRINPLEGNFRVYKVVDGKRIELQSAKVRTQAGKWYVLRVLMVGDQITCMLDDAKLLEVTDGAIRESGTVGLWSKADAASSFDDFTLQNPRDTRYIGPPVGAPGAVDPPPGKGDDDKKR